MTEPTFTALLGFTGGIIGAILGAIIGYLGALKGASISKESSLLLEKSKNAVTLYNEFLSPDMEVIREESSRLIKANNRSITPLTYQQMHQAEDKNYLIAISRLVHFWEKVEKLIENNFVDENLTTELLQNYFRSHYKNFLEQFATYCCENDHDNYQKWAQEVNDLANRWQIGSNQVSKANHVQ